MYQLQVTNTNHKTDSNTEKFLIQVHLENSGYEQNFTTPLTCHLNSLYPDAIRPVNLKTLYILHFSMLREETELFWNHKKI